EISSIVLMGLFTKFIINLARLLVVLNERGLIAPRVYHPSTRDFSEGSFICSIYKQIDASGLPLKRPAFWP
ncbi:MAG: hypothetical protein ACRDBI_06660, partial [Shewanella sp.]